MFDKPFPTMVVGSMPRPQFFRDMVDRYLIEGGSEEALQRLMDRAIKRCASRGSRGRYYLRRGVASEILYRCHRRHGNGLRVGESPCGLLSSWSLCGIHGDR